MQAMNPEISVSGDMLVQGVINNATRGGRFDRSGASFRALDLHFQSSLDPFSMAKVAVAFDPDAGAVLEEGYAIWTGLAGGLTLYAGQFKQQFGVLNRWHEHDLDQVDYPLALNTLFGDGGITQTGIGIRYLMPPIWADTNELHIEITDGYNETLFAGERFTVPTGLIHLKSYWDLNANTYLEFGLTGMAGMNTDADNISAETDPETGENVDDPLFENWTFSAGADLTLQWQPLNQAKYKSLTWRSEAYWTQAETVVGRDWGLGGYSYLQYQIGESWFVGVRGGGVVTPPDYVNQEREIMWQVAPYVTFWQSEFVYMRLQFEHGRLRRHDNTSDTVGRAREWIYGPDTRVLLQINWAMGPHKHEKY